MEEKRLKLAVDLFNEFWDSELGKDLRGKNNKLGGRIRSYKNMIAKGKIKPRSVISLLFDCNAVEIKLKKVAKNNKH